MNFLHLTVWSSRARLTSDVVLLCKEAPSTVCCANLRANFVFSHQEVQVSILEQIFLGPLSCPRKLRLVQVAIFPPLSSSLRFPKVARQHRLKIHFEKNSCQNLSQKMFTFFQSIYQIYAFFGPLFLLPKAPFGHSKSGPHFEKLRSPSHVRAVTLILSVFSYIVFICLYFHIDVFCISISVYFCCFLILCIFRFFVPFVHGARDCLLL